MEFNMPKIFKRGPKKDNEGPKNPSRRKFTKNAILLGGAVALSPLLKASELLAQDAYIDPKDFKGPQPIDTEKVKIGSARYHELARKREANRSVAEKQAVEGWGGIEGLSRREGIKNMDTIATNREKVKEINKHLQKMLDEIIWQAHESFRVHKKEYRLSGRKKESITIGELVEYVDHGLSPGMETYLYDHILEKNRERRNERWEEFSNKRDLKIFAKIMKDLRKQKEANPKDKPKIVPVSRPY